MLAGFVLSFFGDLFLALGSTGIFFILGVLSFSIGHIMFTIGYTSITQFHGKDIAIFGLIFLPCAALMLCGNFEYKNMLVLVIIYAAIICMMVTKAISMRVYYKENKASVSLSIIGSILFFVSDFILLFVFFYPNAHPILQHLNSIVYYGGQGLLALSFGQKLVTIRTNTSRNR